jgi:type VI secretion system protein ImpJ
MGAIEWRASRFGTKGFCSVSITCNNRTPITKIYYAGIVNLKIDEQGFASGELRLLQFEAIWPDGTVIHCGEGTDIPVPPPRKLPADALRTEVYVGLAHAIDGTSLIGNSDQTTVRKYTRSTHQVIDVNSGGSPQELEWAQPNLQVLFGEERRHGFAAFCVAIVLRQENGAFHVQDTHVPPILDFRAAPFLENGLRRILASIVARQKQLTSERRQQQEGSVDFHAMEARKFWLLHTLNGAIPHLNHLLETPSSHPEEVYLTLTNLAGQLCSFSSTVDPNSLPKFDYLGLGGVFEQLFAIILRLLPGEIQKTFIEIGLEHRQDGMFIGKITDPTLLNYELYLGITSSMPEATLRDRVPALLKMASWNQIYDVVKQARRGVNVNVEWQPTAALPVKPGVCFFRVDKSGACWEDVATSGTIALYLPKDGQWAGSSLAMYAVPKVHAH